MDQKTNTVFRAELKFSVSGDLRFCSHHDMMRAIERTVSRAGVELRYTQGFNPRPVMSLSVPRPVGIVSHDDRLVVAFDECVDLNAVIEALNAQAPKGLSFISGKFLDSKKPPQASAVSYKLSLESNEIDRVSARIDALNAQDHWHVERKVKSRRNKRREEPTTKQIDIRPRIADLHIANDEVFFTCKPVDGSWAKPREILALIDLDDMANISRLVRLKIID